MKAQRVTPAVVWTVTSARGASSCPPEPQERAETGETSNPGQQHATRIEMTGGHWECNQYLLQNHRNFCLLFL